MGNKSSAMSASSAATKSEANAGAEEQSDVTGQLAGDDDHPAESDVVAVPPVPVNPQRLVILRRLKQRLQGRERAAQEAEKSNAPSANAQRGSDESSSEDCSPSSLQSKKENVRQRPPLLKKQRRRPSKRSSNTNSPALSSVSRDSYGSDDSDSTDHLRSELSRGIKDAIESMNQFASDIASIESKIDRQTEKFKAANENIEKQNKYFESMKQTMRTRMLNVGKLTRKVREVQQRQLEDVRLLNEQLAPFDGRLERQKARISEVKLHLRDVFPVMPLLKRATFFSVDFVGVPIVKGCLYVLAVVRDSYTAVMKLFSS